MAPYPRRVLRGDREQREWMKRSASPVEKCHRSRSPVEQVTPPGLGLVAHNGSRQIREECHCREAKFIWYHVSLGSQHKVQCNAIC